jgi:hypothetical protein
VWQVACGGQHAAIVTSDGDVYTYGKVLAICVAPISSSRPLSALSHPICPAPLPVWPLSNHLGLYLPSRTLNVYTYGEVLLCP